MRIQPRQQLLEIWTAVAGHSYRDGTWRWGGRDGSDSISDAEQLLCILGPATTLEHFAVHDPDGITDDVASALRGLGGHAEIGWVLLRAVRDYLERYTDDSGTPVFASPVTVKVDDAEPTSEQAALRVVDSFAVSIHLSLAVIGFVRHLRPIYRPRALLEEFDAVEAMAGRRLTAALVGLLRSFTVNIFDIESREGRALLRTVDQRGRSTRQIEADLRRSTQEIRARLCAVTVGSGAGLAADLEYPERLFECGWSWGVVRDAPVIVTTSEIGEQHPGVAEPAPYLSFTVASMDAVAALFSERTRMLGLLDEEQLRLAEALRLRSELTRSYWSKIARLGAVRWPLEDIPWMRTTEKESEYFSLLVSSIVVQDMITDRASDADLNRAGRVLEELAARSRITRRVFGGDEAYRLHAPGFPINLGGSADAGGPGLIRVLSDFAPLLLDRTIRLAGALHDATSRRRMLGLADQIWRHLDARRLGHGDALWDQPSGPFPGFAVHYDEPSWSFTRRVTDCLVTAAEVAGRPPSRSDLLAEIADQQLAEAEHLFDQELLQNAAAAGPAMQRELHELRTALDQARKLLDSRPGTAIALTSGVLARLAGLTAARDDGMS